MIHKNTKLTSLIVLTLFLGSIMGMGMQTVSAQSAPEPATTPGPTSFADEDSIVDPRGQTVKQAEKIHLGRQTVLDIIQPYQWALDVKGIKVIQVNVPINLDLTLGIDFPLNVETSYNPYDVHSGTGFPFVVNVDNQNCTPTANVGIDFLMETSKLSFDLMGVDVLNDIAVNFDDVVYSSSITIPFYGVNTKFGNWISYDIIDKYYTLEDIIGVNTEEYGISGGIGVNLQYNIDSWVTAKAQVTGTDADNVTLLRWDATGNQLVPINVDNDLTHGEYFKVEVGDWVYHIEQSVTFTIWADIGLEVVGLKLLDQTFDWSYKLGLGELTFPEVNDFTFVSYPEVLEGASFPSETAEFNLFNFGWNTEGPGQIGAVGYNIEIPDNPEIQKWFDDMDVSAGIAASIDIEFPFNVRTYYNAHKATSGNLVDYNILVDSIDAGYPAITYQVNGFIDLSSVSIAGLKLEKYDLSFTGNIFEATGFNTPFGDSIYEYEITNLVKLDLASKKLNDYISSVAYGINPDIQFQAWAVLKCNGKLTGDIEIISGNGEIKEITDFVWDEQFDTETARILIDASADPNDDIVINLKNLKYILEVEPGIKLGVTVLGGIIGFDYTFMLPVSGKTDIFTADPIVDTITVQDHAFVASGLTVPDSIVENGGNNQISGSFILDNVGTVLDSYKIEFDEAKLPAGTTGTWTIDSVNYNFGDSTTSISPTADPKTITWTLTLGGEAHKADISKNNVAIKITSDYDSNLVSILSHEITIQPDPTFYNSEVAMESVLDVTPGVAVIVPVRVINTGQTEFTYSLALSGTATQYATWITSNVITVAKGQTGTANIRVLVPAVYSISPQSLDLTVSATYHPEADVETASMEVNIQPFILSQLDLATKVETADYVDMGDDSQYTFNLKNLGNVVDTITVSVISEDDCEYILNGKTANTPLSETLQPNENLAVALQITFDTPGKHSFTVNASNGIGEFYSLTIEVFVKQIEVGAIAKSYNWDNAPIEYTITVYNSDDSGDNFKIAIDGLDKSAYTIESAATSWFYVPGKTPIAFKMILNPTDITKVIGGPMGFRIAVESQAYEYVDDTKYSAIMMKEVYSFKLPETNVVQLNNESYYDISFKLVNEGNVGDTFTISIDGIEDLYFEVVSEEVIPTELGSKSVYVARGQSKDVTVRIFKTAEGSFKPILKIVGSNGDVIGTIVGEKFTVGEIVPLWGIILLTLGGIAVVIGGAFVLITRRNHALYDSDSSSTYRTGKSPKLYGRFDGVKAKLGEMKDSIKSKFDTKKDIEPIIGSDDVESVEKSSRLGQWKEEKKEIDRLSKDKTYWGDKDSDGWN